MDFHSDRYHRSSVHPARPRIKGRFSKLGVPVTLALRIFVQQWNITAMATPSTQQLPLAATLTLADGRKIEVTSEPALREALEGLRLLASGETAALDRGVKHYIKAKRWGALWSVSARRGSFWTLGSFTAALSSDWSERQVRESRGARSLLKWIITSPPPERALSTNQVETLFVEFFLQKKFTLPMSGA